MIRPKNYLVLSHSGKGWGRVKGKERETAGSGTRSRKRDGVGGEWGRMEVRRGKQQAPRQMLDGEGPGDEGRGREGVLKDMKRTSAETCGNISDSTYHVTLKCQQKQAEQPNSGTTTTRTKNSLESWRCGLRRDRRSRPTRARRERERR